jgi:enoyl-CoA hydratase
MYEDLRPVIEVAHDGPVRIVTLNRPEQLNAANAQMHHALASLWPRLPYDHDARAVVVTGAGRAFCAGGDLDLIEAMHGDLALRAQVLAEGSKIVRDMAECALPIVAAVNGPAIGLGCSIASLCDIVLIDERAFFADPHVSVGLAAGDGGAVVFPLLMSLLRAKEYLFTGDRIDASTAVQIGLANRVVPSGTSVGAAVDLAHRLADQPPVALQGTKRAVNQHLLAAIASTLALAVEAENRSFDTAALLQRLQAMRERGS